MRTQCKRIYSALPTQCHRICKGACEAPCVGDASPESRVQSPELRQGAGLFSGSVSKQINSPDPVTSTAARQVWHHLTEGLGWLGLNDHGRSWPLPRRDILRRLLAEFDDDLCIEAARETRKIVVEQDRAPNITALFEKKLRDLAEVRTTVRESLGVTA